MSETITMRHPTLPERQEIVVPKDAMPHYTAAGWQLVPQEELDTRAAAKAKADAEAAAAELRGEQGPELVSLDAETAEQPEKSEPAEEPTERPARSRRAHEKKAEEN